MKGEGRQRKIKGTLYVIKIRTFSLHLQKALLASQTIWNVTKKFLPIPLWRRSQADKAHTFAWCKYKYTRTKMHSGEVGRLPKEGQGRTETITWTNLPLPPSLLILAKSKHWSLRGQIICSKSHNTQNCRDLTQVSGNPTQTSQITLKKKRKAKNHTANPSNNQFK